MIHRLAAALLALAAAALGLRAARSAAADLYAAQGTLDHLRAAVALEPDPARLERLAALEPVSASGLLAEAIRRNPLDAELRIQLAHAEEAALRYAEAERNLLDAATLDAGFAPRWALANFHLRRGDDSKFRHWLALAASFEVDTKPLVRLARRAGLGCPDTVALLPGRIPPGELLDLVLAEGDLEAAACAAGILAPLATPADRGRLLSYIEARLEASLDGTGAGAAVQCWNLLSTRHVIPFPPLSRQSLVNPDFALPPSGRGFDWRLVSMPGVRFSFSPGALRIDLDGVRQDADLLFQPAPLDPGRYVLHAALETPDSALAAGLEWRAVDASGRQLPVTVTGPATYEFSVAAPSRVTRLLLTFRAGRAASCLGSLTLGPVTLRQLEPGVRIAAKHSSRAGVSPSVRTEHSNENGRSKNHR